MEEYSVTLVGQADRQPQAIVLEASEPRRAAELAVQQYWYRPGGWPNVLVDVMRKSNGYTRRYNVLIRQVPQFEALFVENRPQEAVS